MADLVQSPVADGHPSAGRVWLGIAAIMFVGLIPRLWSLTHTEVAARDSIGFIRFALELEKPPIDYRDPAVHFSRNEVLRYSLQMPGYSAWLLAVSQPVRAFRGTTCESMVLSAQLAAILASMLLVIPMVFLGKRLFGLKVAIVAALLFQILPVVVQLTSDGLSESFFLLMSMTALWLVASALESQQYRYYALAGMGIALAYLVRPEGLILGVGFAATLAWLLLQRQIKIVQVLPRGALLAMGFLVVASPYILTIGGLTNKTTGKGIIHYLQGQNVDPTWQSRPDEAAMQSPWLFAVFSSDSQGGASQRAIFALKGLATELLKVGFFVPALLAVVGFFLIWKSKSLPLMTRLILFTMASNVALLFVLGYKIGYISERHVMLLVCLGSFCAAFALMKLVECFESVSPRQIQIAALIGFAVCYACDFRQLHPNRAGHHAAGVWLAKTMTPDEVLWDPFNWAEFYAGRSIYGEPDRNPVRGPVYAVLEPTHNTAHSRLPMMTTAQDIAKQGEMVYHWPENKPAEQAKVVIFKTVSFKKNE